MNKMYKMVYCIMVVLTLVTGANAIPYEEWNRTYDFCGDSSGCSQSIDFVQQTKDGGYIATSSLYYSEDPLMVDGLIVLFKTDKKGNIQWKKDFDGWIGYVRQTRDGGYVLIGDPGPPFGTDILLVKLDSIGTVKWEKLYRFGSFHTADSIQQTVDGGYIIAGTVGFDCCDWSTSDIILVKIDSIGNIQWNKTFGGSRSDTAKYVQQTKDGEYIIAGSISGNATLIKTDKNGNKLWSKTFGTGNINSVQETTHGNYIMAGSISDNVVLINTDKNGNKLWRKTFGETEFYDYTDHVQQTVDGGYIVIGNTKYDDRLYRWYGWIIKTDNNGNKLWNKTLSGCTTYVQQTTDNGYIIAGDKLIKLGADTVTTTNLLKNQGFEESYNSLPRYWTKFQTGNKAIFTYPETGRVGGKSVAIKYLTKETGKVALWRQTGIVVVPSMQYKLSGYMKLSDVTGGGSAPRYNGASIRVSWYKSDGSVIKTDLITRSGTSGWTKYEKTFTAPSNAVKATVGGDLYNAAGKVWFDDISFIKI